MATLQNSVQNCEDLTSFQEIFTTCYSHGLESIYKLQTVDLKSVRKLAVVEESLPKPIKIKEEWFDDQLSFDLGPYYCEWIASFINQEPIQVLQLAKPIEKNLLGWGFNRIGSLRKLNLQSLKMGQGHIEEVRQRLGDYLSGKPLVKNKGIDFLSLIKCVCADKDPCKTYVLLEAYGLHEWINLTPSESMEIKRSQNKNEWALEMRSLIAYEVLAFFTPIIETFVKPWVHRRGGIANKEEIEEFLILKGLDPTYAQSALELFGLNFGEIIVFSKEHQLIHQTIESYFVNPKAYFLLNELIILVAKELALKWVCVSEEQIKRILYLSSSFKVFRALNGVWNVKLMSI